MNNSPYACSLCKRMFGRRGNAQRHNFTHFNQGEIFDRFDNLVINLRLPQAKISVLGDNGIDGVFQAGVKESNKNHNHDHMLGIPLIKNVIKREVKSENDVYDESIEKLLPITNELDVVLSNYPQRERGCIRDMVIMSFMSSFDPISNLKETLSFIKNNKLSNEIRDCISSYCNIHPSMASVVLRNSILRKHKSNVCAEKANNGYILQHQQQQQQQPRSPPYFVPSINRLMPYNQRNPNMKERID
ncbi:MAG: hypothetical protein WKF36_07845 [Candidatus Nitrosocosmicus sp.]